MTTETVSKAKFAIGDTVTGNPNLLGAMSLRRKRATIVFAEDLAPAAGTGWVYRLKMEDGTYEAGIQEQMLIAA